MQNPTLFAFLGFVLENDVASWNISVAGSFVKILPGSVGANPVLTLGENEWYAIFAGF
jgi:hypothetical protein